MSPNHVKDAPPHPARQSHTLRKALLAAVKLTISLAIIGYLARQAWRDASFHELVSQPKHWEFLLLGGLCTFVSVILTYIRWWFLVRRFELDCTVRQACRLGLLGYLFNFFSLGVIGGDVLRAVFLARHNPGRRTAAVASVLLDRLIGVYVLFVVAMVGCWFIDLNRLEVRDPAELTALRRLCDFTYVVVVVGGLGMLAVMAPGISIERWSDIVGRLPFVNRFRDRIVVSIDNCRRHGSALAGSLGASVVVHILNVLGIYFVALGLPGEEPSFATHFIIAPLAILAGTVPLPGGLGAIEYALDFLYRAVTSATVAPRQGFLVALGYRVVTMVIAAVGFAYYLTSRGEVRELIAEAEQGEPHGDDPQPDGATQISAT